jgi:hypothetical protein
MKKLNKKQIDKIQSLTKKGMSQRAVAKEVGCSRSVVYYHLNKIIVMKKPIKKEVEKKVKAPKVQKEAKPKKLAPVKKVKYELLNFEITATIPTQMYGNICPRISIKAGTIEDAKSIVVPFIEELYSSYASEGPDGKKANFVNKAKVTVEEKFVDPKTTTVPVAPAPVSPATVPTSDKPVQPIAPVQKNESVSEPEEESTPKTPAYIKAENAIKAAMSLDALGMIEDQIQKSVKLTAEEKPLLLTDVLKKRKEF